MVVDEFEAEFEADFEEMVSDSINQRAHDKIVPQVKEIMVPQVNNQKSAPSTASTAGQNGSAPTNFMILMRSQNKNKPQLKHIELEDNNELALKIAQTQKREREEKLRVKQLTLTMNMRYVYHNLELTFVTFIRFVLDMSCLWFLGPFLRSGV